MKKIYALAAVAMMAASAMAQNGAPLYMVGNGEGLGWDPAAPLEIPYADGNYTVEIANLVEFKLSPSMGDWDTFNGTAIGVPNITDEMLGTAITLEPWGENTKTPWKGDYTVVVAGDLSTITLTTDTPKPTGVLKVYLRGDMNSWGSPEEWEMHPYNVVDDVAQGYQFTCNDDQVITAGEAFKIADADWNAINLGSMGEAYLMDTEMDMLQGSNDNCTLDEEWNGVVYVDIASSMVFFSNDKTAENPFYTENGVEGVQVDNNEAAVYYNLQGVRVNAPENGLYIVVKGGKAVKTIVK